jgi:hypothetical protein
MPYRNDKSLTGTARYASLHAHLGEELSRRDDFEAIGYVLIYLYKGSLPWQNIFTEDKNERYRQIKDMKQSISVSELTRDCPPEFNEYLTYCKSLQFEDEPNYDYMLGLFTKVADREGINLYDNVFDWSMKAVTVKNYPNFYHYLEQENQEIFNQNGQFIFNPNQNKFTEQHFIQIQKYIMNQAANYQFDEPKGLMRLIRREEIKRLRPSLKNIFAQQFDRQPSLENVLQMLKFQQLQSQRNIF